MAGQAISDRFDAFLFDLDGVVYVGEEPLPGAVESLTRLREAGKQVRFLTNNPRPTRAQIARKLADMGVEAREVEVVSSGRATASYLRDEGIGAAYVIGSRGLMTEVLGAGVELVDAGPCEAVVVGADEYVTFAHVRQAVRLIFEGARFVATNADASFPTPKGPLPGTGAIVAAVQITTGQKPFVVGKPFPPMFDVALEGLDRARAVMIGDTPNSDIEGARRAGIPGVLISEYGSSARKGNTSPADATIKDLNGLFDPDVVLRERYEEVRP